MIFDSKNNALKRAKINLYNLKDYSKFNKKIEIPRPLVKNENFTSLSLVIMNYRQPLSHDAVNIRADCNVLTAQSVSVFFGRLKKTTALAQQQVLGGRAQIVLHSGVNKL